MTLGSSKLSPTSEEDEFWLDDMDDLVWFLLDGLECGGGDDNLLDEE